MTKRKGIKDNAKYGILGAKYGKLGKKYGILGAKYGILGGRPKKEKNELTLNENPPDS